MKAFLSHSSKDKGVVEEVAKALRPGTYSIDSQTFDFGSTNSRAILDALKQSDLFVLFLSSHSVSSSYVDFETLIGIELLASGEISRFLAVCLDEEAYKMASASTKYFNCVRIGYSTQAITRLIQGELISAAALHVTQRHPFVGREEEIKRLGEQVMDHARSPSKALYLSGNTGAGRRTIAMNFYGDYFPHVGKLFPSISIRPFEGLEELHRTIIGALQPTLSAIEIIDDIKEFSSASDEERVELVAAELNKLLKEREAAFLIDDDGLLTDRGSLVPELNEVLEHVDSSPHPPLVMISPRMIPMRHRRVADDISYLPVRSLERDAAKRLISSLARGRGVALTPVSLDELTELSDSHPYNVYRMMDEVAEYGIDLFLANPRSYIEWKHRQSSEYLGMVELNEAETLVLGALTVVPELDYQSIVGALELPDDAASEALSRLADLHVVETTGGRFKVAPAVRVAVERDPRVRLRQDLRKGVVQRLASALSLRVEDGTAPVVLINSTVLACLQRDRAMPQIVGAFLLPSHYIWMAKRNYDERRWKECIRFARLALDGKDRLSTRGIVGACRFLCLASARIGDQWIFREGMRTLREEPGDSWAESNIAFLEGFNLRLKGQIPEAEDSFRKAYRLSPGNYHAGREIASICLERGNLDESERFAREVHQRAPHNPFVVDVLTCVLIRRHGGGGRYKTELEEMFGLLEQVGEEGGRSFFTTRRAEFEHLWGDNREAERLIERAVKRTPSLFEPRRIHANILLKAGNIVKAKNVIDDMKRMVESRRPNDERRSNYRLYLETWARYLTEVGQYEEARQVFEDRRVFTEEEAEREVRDIKIAEGYRSR